MDKKYTKQENVFEYDSEEYSKKKEALTSFFLDKSYVLMTFKQIVNILDVKKEQIPLLEEILSDLQEEALIFLDDSNRYVPCYKLNIKKCVYNYRNEHFGFAIAQDDKKSDIYIPYAKSLNAMDKDEVLVKIDEKYSKGSNKSAEGTVIKILKRNTKILVGRLVKSKNFGFVGPIKKIMPDIYIPKKQSEKYKDGQIVQVEITKYATKSSKAEGKILNVVGNINTPNVEVKALEVSYGLDKMREFNSPVKKELFNIPNTVLSSEKVGRIDKTSEVIVTIDSEDAKDLDDAVCVKKINDNYLLSVFIADVSHYVKDKTALDKEASLRGTSIYIPGTVIPMLPKELSNGICSLNAGVERLALAIDILFDKDGKAINSEVYKAVIKVDKKMTYEKVAKVIERSDSKVLKEYSKYIDDIDLMCELAKILRNKRFAEGSINFDIPDTQVVLEGNSVKDIKAYELTMANYIIEEFMLAANMEIAEKFHFLELPFIYRVHEKPDEEKLTQLNGVLANYKKRIKGIKNIHPKALSAILNEIEDEEEKQVISRYMLRTLKLAKYSENCDGHFGLAAKYYCHFTSPIRRYPDLFIHRVISDYIENGYKLDENKQSRYSKQAIKYSILSSEAEKQATIIERDFDDLYIAIYMSKFIGNEFDAIISSITQFGMFVKLQNTVEGLVPFEYMPGNDYFIYDEKRKILVGRNTSKTFKVGDKVKVKLMKSDVKLKRLDFQVISR